MYTRGVIYVPRFAEPRSYRAIAKECGGRFLYTAVGCLDGDGRKELNRNRRLSREDGRSIATEKGKGLYTREVDFIVGSE